MQTAAAGLSARASLCFATVALLLGALLIGFAHVAQLPPWEGFDETAHYSYIEQMAGTGTWPRFGDPVSADVEDYLELAPGPPPLDPKWSYLQFFAAPRDVVEAGRAAIHSPRDPARPWRPGQGANWQAQHPPLYYGLMAAAYRASQAWSLAAQLALLRGLSYLLAWLGLCLAVLAAIDRGPDDPPLRGALILAPALWPYLFPAWFPDMGRLGNDSLLALLAACSWLFLSRIESKDDRIPPHIALGIALGLGLLTKATFLPFVAALVAFLIVRAWQRRTAAAAMRRRLYGLAACLAVAAAISGWWYVGKLIETGNAIGSNDVILLQRAGGLLKALEQQGSVLALLRGILFLPVSFLWTGTWSVIVPPMVSYLPLLLMIAAVVLGYLRQVRAHRPDAVEWVPLAALMLLVGSLVQHGLVLMALTGAAGVLGWYIHSYAPVVARLCGFGVAGAMRLRGLRPLFLVLVWYPCWFLPAAYALQALYYAGCSSRPARFVTFDPATMLPCAADPGAVFERLAVLGFPVAAAGLFAAGWLATVLGVWSAVAFLRRASGDRNPSVVSK